MPRLATSQRQPGDTLIPKARFSKVKMITAIKDTMN